VSSKCSGGEHDSTGLGAKHKLITPLLRCASPETATLYSELFETTTAKQKGEPSAPLFAFSAWPKTTGQKCQKRLSGLANDYLLSVSLMRVTMRNLAVVMPALRMPVVVPVVR